MSETARKGTSPPKTHTGSLNCVFTSVITARIDSSFENMSSVASAWPPINVDIYLEVERRLGAHRDMTNTWLIIGPMRPLSVESFPSAFSSTLGKERKRRVWPVGAVSNTIAEYSMDLTCLHTRTVRFVQLLMTIRAG